MLIVCYGIELYILCCVLVVCYPDVVILRLCAIVVWSFVRVAIGISTVFGWLLLPICLFWCVSFRLLWFELHVLGPFVGGGGFVVCVACGDICVWCGLFVFVEGVDGVGNIVDACFKASLMVLGVCL